MISLRNVSKQFQQGGGAAVNDLTLEVHEGETVVLVGPSGCGKTTTMKMINRLIEPTSGSIHVDGRDVMEQDPVELRRRIGYVIQSIGLLPHRTVRQNIATVPGLVGWDEDRIGKRVDEPFAAVDPIVRARLQDEFLGIQERLRKTIVFVTHDIDEAIKMADRIAILNRGAKLEQYASPEEILRAPASSFVQDFVGAERGLKRLALIPVSAIQVEPGPVVGPEASAEETRRAIQEGGFGWVSVVDGGELLGWVDEQALKAAATARDAKPRKFSAYVTAKDSLRQALDSIVTSSTNVAVVVSEGQHYLGILTLDRLSKEITQ